MGTGAGITLSPDQGLGVILLIKIGLMAAVAALLARFDTFKRLFVHEREGIRARGYFIVLMGGLFAAGVGARILLGYAAADMALEGTLLAGLVGGPWVGAAVGLFVGLPALGVGELLAVPVGVLAGLTAGLLHGLCFRRRDRILFSPLRLFFVRRFDRAGGAGFNVRSDVIVLGAIVGLRLLELLASRTYGIRWLYAPQPEGLWALAAVLAGTVVMIGAPLMIWDHTYVETALAEHERGLAQARLEALKSRIQPHFLFNTLNTIAAAIRSDPPGARTMVVKLSQILRTILDTKDDFRPLEEELRFIHDYLDIERARFGGERLRVETEVPASLLGARVPFLLIQPIVENSLTHGLRRKRAGGTIAIRGREVDGELEVVVEDDGAGIPRERLADVKRAGIGLSNVDERLRVLYGGAFRFDIESEEGRGTRTTIRLPLGAGAFPRADTARGAP